MEESEVKKQWHGPFCSAVRLELMENKADFDFQQEYQLSTKPLQIDFLVIRRMESYNPVMNEIGKIFRGHNLMEYKSPEDELNVDTYFKVLGYACLYKAFGESVDAIRDDDITLSLVREGYPRELFRYFEKRGYAVEEKYPGIYYVQKEGFFPIQVIVSRKLDKDLHIWLTSLTRDMNLSEAERLVYRIGMLTEKDDRMNARAVFCLAARANKEVFGSVKEDRSMITETSILEEALEIMWPTYKEDYAREVQKAANELANELANERADKLANERADKLANERADKLADERVKERLDAAVKDATAKVDTAAKTAAKAAAENIMKECNFSLEKACRIAGISVEDYEKLKASEANPEPAPEADSE